MDGLGGPCICTAWMDGSGDLDGSLGTRLMIVQPSVWSPDYWYGWSVDGGRGGGMGGGGTDHW